MQTVITISGREYIISSTLNKKGVPFPNADKNVKTVHNRFRVSVIPKDATGQEARFDYYGSQADYEAGKTVLTEEELKQAFRCFVEDAQSGTMDFREFCSEYGYDEDSRRAEKIHKACQESLREIKALGFSESELIDVLNELQEQGVE